MDTTKRKYSKKDGYTVSVVYFLRKEKDDPLEALKKLSGVKKDNDDEEEASQYPIYVRVTFLGKTVSLRSRLMAKTTVDDYDSYMGLAETIRFITIEENTIRATVRLFKPELNPEFKISEWSSFYNELNISLFTCVRKFISEELKQVLYNDPVISSYQDSIRILSQGLQALPFLASLKFKPGVDLLEKYISLFKMLDFDKSNYTDFTLVEPHYSAWDWKTGSLLKMLESENNPYVAEGGPLLDHILSLFTPPTLSTHKISL